MMLSDAVALVLFADVAGEQVNSALTPDEAAYLVTLISVDAERPSGINIRRLLRLFGRIEELGY